MKKLFENMHRLEVNWRKKNKERKKKSKQNSERKKEIKNKQQPTTSIYSINNYIKWNVTENQVYCLA